MKTASTLLALAFLHGFLSVYSFGVLIGYAHMREQDRPLISQSVWTAVMHVTWQPLLQVTHDRIRVNGKRLFDTHWLLFMSVNSLAAVGIGYGVFRGISHLRSRRRTHP